MTIAIDESEQAPPPDSYLLLENVSWKLYEQFRRETDDGHLQITFDNGSMEIMSPSLRHERRKKLLSSFISVIALERDIPICDLGSTTFTREELLKGVEPDECFYIQNELRVRAKEELDLEIDPPPDLVIEVDVAHRSIEREPIYAALGVPELWRHNGLKLSFRQLEPRLGVYTQIEYSLAFPFLRAEDLDGFLQLIFSEPQTALLRRFRDWVRPGM